MASNHLWRFDGFVDRLQDLKLTPKKHLELGFTTLFKEFAFDLKDPHYADLLKDLFIQEGTDYDKDFPDGFMELLFQGNPPCPVQKSKIRNQHFQAIVEKLEEIHGEMEEPRPMFVDVCEAIKSVFNSVTASEAVEKLNIIKGLDVVSLEYVFRILTNKLNERFSCDNEEIKKWLIDYESNPKILNTGIVGIPLKPMLLVKMSTNRYDYNEKIIKTCGNRFLAETKYDGERLLIHKSRNTYKFYSRNGIDYSEKLGTDSTQRFAARIHSVFKDYVDSCIIDGELLVWDKNEERLVGKNEKASDGKIYDVKNLLEKGVDERFAVTRCFCAFDVLHLNGTDLVDWTLTARLKHLHNLFKPEEMAKHTIFVSNHVVVDTREFFVEYYNRAMDQKLEGIVVKSLFSTYKFGTRAINDGWFKVKPDYGKHNTLDLAVVAVKISKQGKILSYIVAGLKSKDPLLLKAVGGIMPFLKRSDKERLQTIIKGEEYGFRDNKLPEWMDIMIIDKNTRFVHLRNICVVEVRAAGIMRGSLRFPSIVSIRGDKDILDIDTITMVNDYENSIRKKIDPNLDDSSGVPKKRKVQASIPSDFNRYTSSNSDGYEVCMIDVKSIKEEELEKLSDYGLKFVPNVTKTCQCVITENPKSFRLKGVKKQNLQHILNTDWLQRCLESGSMVSWKDTDFIAKCENADLDLLKENIDDDDEEDKDMDVDSDIEGDVEMHSDIDDDVGIGNVPEVNDGVDTGNSSLDFEKRVCNDDEAAGDIIDKE